MTPSQLNELALIQSTISKLEKRLEKVKEGISTLKEHQTRIKLSQIIRDLGSINVQIGNL